MIQNIVKFVFSMIGFAAGRTDANPQVPGPLAHIVDKFSGVLAAAGAIWWLIGNRADVVSLNYLELAGVVLLFNMAFKADPPGPSGGANV